MYGGLVNKPDKMQRCAACNSFVPWLDVEQTDGVTLCLACANDRRSIELLRPSGHPISPCGSRSIRLFQIDPVPPIARYPYWVYESLPSFNRMKTIWLTALDDHVYGLERISQVGATIERVALFELALANGIWEVPGEEPLYLNPQAPRDRDTVIGDILKRLDVYLVIGVL